MRWGNPTIDLKVCDGRSSGKRRNVFFCFLCLGKAAVDALAIFVLASYALPVCCFINIVFPTGAGYDCALGKA